MNLFSTILANISILTLPYIILLASLGCCALLHRMTLTALLNKYKKARNLFNMMFALQVIIVSIAFICTIGMVVNSPNEISSPTEFLFMLAKLIYLIEAIFVSTLMADDTVDTIHYISKDLSKQSFQKSIKI